MMVSGAVLCVSDPVWVSWLVAQHLELERSHQESETGQLGYTLY